MNVEVAKPVKKSANLSVDRDLLVVAKSFGINLSATSEQALEAEVTRFKADQWLSENRDAIEASNAFVEKHGLFSGKFRPF